MYGPAAPLVCSQWPFGVLCHLLLCWAQLAEFATYWLSTLAVEVEARSVCIFGNVAACFIVLVRSAILDA